MNQHSILLRIRNEGPYLLEWIAHYLTLGFDDIAIVYNENDDGSTPLLELFQQHGICRAIESPMYYEDGMKLTPGQRAVRTIKDNALFANSRWLFTADADELLILKKHRNISEFVDDHADSDQIIISWDLFVPDLQSSDFNGEFNMRQRFSSAIDDHSHIKSLTRIDRFPEKIAPHRILSKSRKTTFADGRSIDPAELGLRNWKSDFDDDMASLLVAGKSAASLYHYRFKSAAEFCLRQERGVAGPHSLKNNGMFFVKKMLTDSELIRSIDTGFGQPRMYDQQATADRLLALPGVAEIQEQLERGYAQQIADIEANSLTYRFIRRYLDNPNDFSATATAMDLLDQHSDSAEMLWLAAFCHRHEEKYEQAYQLSSRAIKFSPAHETHHRFFVNNMKKAAELARTNPPGGKPAKGKRRGPAGKKRRPVAAYLKRLLGKS